MKMIFGLGAAATVKAQPRNTNAATRKSNRWKNNKLMIYLKNLRFRKHMQVCGLKMKTELKKNYQNFEDILSGTQGKKPPIPFPEFLSSIF